jgi:hypothetical protein
VHPTHPVTRSHTHAAKPKGSKPKPLPGPTDHSGGNGKKP